MKGVITIMYVYLMKNLKPLNEEVVKKHVEHLKELKSQGKLVLCGPFTDYPGGMVVITAENLEEATKIAEADPFMASGCKTFEIRTMEQANEENHYLLEE
jgi:uncharacterized protein YciI